MVVQWRKVPAFFRRRPEVVPAGFLEGEAAATRRRRRELRWARSSSATTARTAARRRSTRRSSWPRELGDSVVVVFGYAPPGHLGRRDRRTRGGDRGARREDDGRGASSVRRGAASRSRSSWSPKRAAEALIEVADERDARMIVVGSFGDPPLKGDDPRLDPEQASAPRRPAGAGGARG